MLATIIAMMINALQILLKTIVENFAKNNQNLQVTDVAAQLLKEFC